MNQKLKLINFIAIVLLLTASPVIAKSGKLSFGIVGGGAFNIAIDAIEDHTFTKFKRSLVYGVNIMYTYPGFPVFALELCVERVVMDLEELGEEMGTLEMTPVMILFKFQSIPQKETGFGIYANWGWGISLNKFKKGPYITELEKTLGVRWKIETDDVFVSKLGTGFYYFFTKNLSINLEAQLFIGEVNTSWDIEYYDRIENVVSSAFMAKNIQLLLGVRYWF